MSEWVGAEKEVAEKKVEVKTKGQKATDETGGQRAKRQARRERKGGVDEKDGKETKWQKRWDRGWGEGSSV